MKVLCLHAMYGNGTKFKMQLRTFLEAIQKVDPDMEFVFIDGPYRVHPPPGFSDYFGPPPHYSALDVNDNGRGDIDEVLPKVNALPKGLAPEEKLRLMLGDRPARKAPLARPAMDRLHRMLDQDPEIQGVLGYSEGAMVASTLILEETRRQKEEGRTPQIKLGVFFGGWPPLLLENGTVRFLLSDECEESIYVPTVSVVGCNDPYIDGSLALYNMCDEDTATLFDHGMGHNLPSDPKTVDELASAVKHAWDKAGEAEA
ncbi:serine hydrolase FSH [Podospora didyma]|uniref:Serine hydrolase FSH n=1 Tax=Podospora didyma TaxID=330526 RepID=A0AAE0NR55_9PEZI|nr:serine hydrolase FSH [Podospora didyma]